MVKKSYLSLFDIRQVCQIFWISGKVDRKNQIAESFFLDRLFMCFQQKI